MDDVTITPDAGADTPVANADLQGDPTEVTPEGGAEPTSQVAEPDAEGETPPSQKGENVTEGKQKHQTTLEERVTQLAEKRFAEMQAKFESTLQEKQAAEAKPFVAVDMERVNDYFQTREDHIAELKLEGKFVEARRIQQELNELDAQLIKNEAARVEWEKQQQTRQAQQSEYEGKLRRLDESAEFYRAQKNIPQATWDAAGKWMADQFQADPVLARKFTDMVDRQGEMAAFEWADQYVQQHMGAAAAADKANKDAGKGAIPTGQGTPASTAGITSFKDLLSKPSSEINKFAKENPDQFQKLKEAHFK